MSLVRMRPCWTKIALNSPSHHEETVCRHTDGEHYGAAETRTTQLQGEVDGRQSESNAPGSHPAYLG